MKKIAIVAAYRSAIGSFGGSLKDIKLADLGAQVLTYALEKSTISPNLVEKLSLEMYLVQVRDKMLPVRLHLVLAFPKPLLPLSSTRFVAPA